MSIKFGTQAIELVVQLDGFFYLYFEDCWLGGPYNLHKSHFYWGGSYTLVQYKMRTQFKGWPICITNWAGSSHHNRFVTPLTKN